MSLNNGTADAVATAFCSAEGITDPAAVAKWKSFCQKMYAGLKTDIVATIPINTVVTVGGPATQTGPTTPVVAVIS